MRYFKHDSDANMDAKLQRLRLHHGMAGYGVYWFVLELIAREVDRDNMSFRLEHDVELLAANTGMSLKELEPIISTMIHLGLLQDHAGIVGCSQLRTRCDEYTSKLISTASRQQKNSAGSGDGNDRAKCDDSGAARESVQRRSRVTPKNVPLEKKRKEDSKRSAFVPPTEDELTEYLLLVGSSVSAKAFMAYYESKGWRVGNSPMKSWKAAVKTWELRDRGLSRGEKAPEVYT